MEDLKEKIREIVMEVIKKYYSAKILVVVTGGTVNFDVSLKELAALKKEQEISYTVLFSRKGSKIHDVNAIIKELEPERVVIDGEEIACIRKFLKPFKAVVVAALSRNTASKIANLFSENLTTEVIIDSLMLGIPVIAAKDAAYPCSEAWRDLGFIWMGTGLRKAYEDVLKRVEEYGVILCDSNELKQKVEGILWQPKTKAREDIQGGTSSGAYIEKNIVTAQDLMPYRGKGDEIYIPQNAILTPLAMDFIREYDVKVYRK
ncbi:flavoprotein [Thermosediminibacter litoriperuensis]|uniref:Flavoprotein n=1 Tax=Thermosediminibacter litoriperuensis TaxID=291989 RepID=A0A5S5ASS1_9FIRM|nr:flavoprotein [Thermosediminibacter litoriperuensis]TYP55475.1 flavoprotein [Thermosediminibacter litoriperuensis]